MTETKAWRFDGELFVVTDGQRTLYNIQDAWIVMKEMQAQLAAKEREFDELAAVLRGADPARDDDSIRGLGTGKAFALLAGEIANLRDSERGLRTALAAKEQELATLQEYREATIATYQQALIAAKERAKRAEGKAALAEWLRKELRHRDAHGNFVGGDAALDAIEFTHRFDALSSASTEELK